MRVSAGPTYVDERKTFSDDGPSLPEYVRLDAATSYRAESFTLRLHLENVTNEEYLTGGFRGDSGGLPGAPRSLTLSGTYNF